MLGMRHKGFDVTHRTKIYRLTFREGFGRRDMEEVERTLLLGMLCATILHGELAVKRAFSYMIDARKRGAVLNVDEASKPANDALDLCIGLCEREYGKGAFRVDVFDMGGSASAAYGVGSPTSYSSDPDEPESTDDLDAQTGMTQEERDWIG